jgi:hypothetical protein
VGLDARVALVGLDHVDVGGLGGLAWLVARWSRSPSCSWAMGGSVSSGRLRVRAGLLGVERSSQRGSGGCGCCVATGSPTGSLRSLRFFGASKEATAQRYTDEHESSVEMARLRFPPPPTAATPGHARHRSPAQGSVREL